MNRDEVEDLSFNSMKRNLSQLEPAEVPKYRPRKRSIEKSFHEGSNNISNEMVSYPYEDLHCFPIVDTQVNEIIYLYFPKEEFEYLEITLKPEGVQVFKDTEVLAKLQEYILAYLNSVFNSFKLDKRIMKSYEPEMAGIIPRCSLVIEMSKKFKGKKSIMKKLKNFRDLQMEVFNNINMSEEHLGRKDPFSMLKETDHKNLLPKWGRSFKNEEKDSDDEEEKVILDETQFQLKAQKPIDYKEMLERIFVKKLPDFRRKLVKYCLDADSDFTPDNFAKFVSYLEFFIALFSGIMVKYYIDELGFLDMDFYASEKIYNHLAEISHYQVQFKIMDLPITKAENEMKGKKLNVNKESNKQKRLIEVNQIQYEEYEYDQVERYPPHTHFVKEISDKFRRFDYKDDYHICSECENSPNYKQTSKLKCSSCFRGIDKCRLLSSTLFSICDFNFILKKIKEDSSPYSNVFKSILIMQNTKDREQLKYRKLVQNYLMPIQSVESKRLDKEFRNLFGEEIGFYYIWLSHYLKWLLFPSVFGLVVYIIFLLMRFFHAVNHNLVLGINLLFAVTVLLWGNYYVSSWKSVETVSLRFWGMDSFKLEKSNDLLDNCKTDYILFLGVKIPVLSKMNQLIRRAISYTIILISLLATISLNLLVFYIQTKKMYEKDKSPLASHRMRRITKGNVLYLIPILIFVIRELSSAVYRKIAKWLTGIENHISKEEYKESLLKKQIWFEFFNYYFNLYYIAFAKRYFQNCTEKDCFMELGNQLIIILASQMVVTATKLFYKGIFRRNQTKRFESKLVEKYAISSNTSRKFIYYTRTEFKEDEASSLFLPIVFNFGYIMQFGTSSPLSFVLMLILSLFTRLANGVSMGHLLYVKTFNESHGIGLFNRAQGLMAFLGLFSNLFVIFYTHNQFIPLSPYKKIIYFVLAENFIFLVLKVVRIGQKPFWFKYTNQIEIKYLKQYGIRPKKIKSLNSLNKKKRILDDDYDDYS